VTPSTWNATTSTSEIADERLLHALFRHKKSHSSGGCDQDDGSVHELVHVVAGEDDRTVLWDVLFAEHLDG